MIKKKLLFVSLSLLIMFVFPNSISKALPRSTTSPVQEEVAENFLIVDIYVYLSPEYKIISFYSPCAFRLDIELQVNQVQNVSSIELSLPVKPTSLPPGSESYVSIGGFWVVRLPATTDTYNIICEDEVPAMSFLYRNVASIPGRIEVTDQITSNIDLTRTFTRLVILPENAVLFSSFKNITAFPIIDFEGKRAISWLAREPVMYEPKNWEFNAFIASILTVASLFLILYIPKRIPKRASSILGITGHVGKIGSKIGGFIKSATLLTQKATPKKFLALFLLCGLLMVSFSATAGPDPRLKLFVFSSRQGMQELFPFLREEFSDDVVIYPFAYEKSDFDLLCRLGVVSTVIIADFPSVPELTKYIYPGLKEMEGKIFILEEHAEDGLARDARNYGLLFLESGSKGELKQFLQEKLEELRGSALLARLGASISHPEFAQIASIIAILSLVIVFIGSAFLVVYITEESGKHGILGISEALLAGIFTFFFIQAVFTICSSLIATPIGLHAAKPGVTVLQYLGRFGGGSTPRALTAFAGYWFAMLVQNKKQRLKLSVVALVLFVIVLFILLLNPLTSGTFMYEFMYGYLLPGYPGASPLQKEVTTIATQLIYTFSQMLRVPYISRGVTFFFISIIPLCALSKTEKITTTFLALIISVPITHVGLMRVGEMEPSRAVPTIIPGMLIGILFFALFLLIGNLEAEIRKRGFLKKRQGDKR